MSTSLSPENANFIREVVASGLYQTEQQALDAAVALLKARERLRQDLLEGMVDAERGDLIPAEIVFERLEKRAAEIDSAARTAKQ